MSMQALWMKDNQASAEKHYLYHRSVSNLEGGKNNQQTS